MPDMALDALPFTDVDQALHRLWVAVHSVEEVAALAPTERRAEIEAVGEELAGLIDRLVAATAGARPAR